MLMLTRITTARHDPSRWVCEEAKTLTGEPHITICRHVPSSNHVSAILERRVSCGFINTSRRKGRSSGEVNKNLWFT